MFESFVLIAAALAPPPAFTDGDGAVPLSFCQVARPIYVQAADYQYLSSTVHGRALLDDLERLNQAYVDLCADVPRTIFKQPPGK